MRTNAGRRHRDVVATAFSTLMLGTAIGCGSAAPPPRRAVASAESAVAEPTAPAPAPSPAPTAAPAATIAWTPHPVPERPPPPPEDAPEPTPVRNTTAPACRDGELALRARFAPPVAGMTSPVGGVLEITNAGTAFCRVQTKVTWWVGTKPADFAVTSELGPPAFLDPGDMAASALTWWGQKCSGTTELDVIHVSFATNDGLGDRDVPATGLLRGPCQRPDDDLGSGSWAVAVRTREVWVYPKDVVRRLVPTLVDTPKTTKGGQPIRFAVVLTNVTDETAVFDHSTPGRGYRVECPTVVFGVGDFVPQRHELACDAARSITAGTSVRFEFEITAPDPGVEPITNLHWQFDALPGNAVRAPVTLS